MQTLIQHLKAPNPNQQDSHNNVQNDKEIELGKNAHIAALTTVCIISYKLYNQRQSAPNKHWADGGITGVTNGVLLCNPHHKAVHEGGYSIERIIQDTERFNELIAQQRHDNDVTQFDVEHQLRARGYTRV